jgi:hypothetical protein
MPEPYHEPAIDTLARRIRLAFFEEKGRALKKKYKPSERHDRMDFYRAAATNVLDLKCDPCDYVKAAMMYCRIAGGPFANQLGSGAAKNWYQQYAHHLGIPSEPALQNRLAPAAPPEEGQETQEAVPEVFEVKYACDVELQEAIEMVLCTLHNNTGSIDPKTPANLEILRDPFFQLPAEARALMGDEVTLIKFGREIYDFYQTRPNFVEAARRRGFKIDQILKWIDAQLRMQ